MDGLNANSPHARDIRYLVHQQTELRSYREQGGTLMARGTSAEIVAQSGLHALVAAGPGADRLAGRLRDAPGVTAAAAFGATLHVCGPERRALLAAVAPFRADPAISWQEAEPTLEDIFIHLMAGARDNAEGGEG